MQTRTLENYLASLSNTSLQAGTKTPNVNSGTLANVDILAAINATITITSPTYNLISNNSYIIRAGTLATLTLPITSIIGDTIEIIADDIYGWKVAQNAGQMITFNTLSSTIGVSGYIQSTEFDIVKLKCTNTSIWRCVSAMGADIHIF